MAKEGVSIPRGTPPTSVRESEELKKRLLGGGPKPEEVAEQKPIEVPYYTDEVQQPSRKPKLHVKTARLSGELLDIDVPYIDCADTEFSVLFSLPEDTKLGVKPKNTMDFVLECEDVTRQRVTYIGSPVEFKQTGIKLLVLLKTD